MPRRLLRVVVVVLLFYAVMAAIALLLRRLIPSLGDEESDEIALAAVGTGIDLRSRAPSFRGGSARAIMGGLDLDLRAATLDPAGGRLVVRAIMGGVQVTVPDTWRLEPAPALVLLGGVDLPRVEEAGDPDGPALELIVLAALGGVQVSVRPAAIA
jgi:hypothetical protein